MSKLPNVPPKETESLQKADTSQDDAPSASSELRSSEALRDWNKNVMTHMKRISDDEDYRLEVSKKLS